MSDWIGRVAGDWTGGALADRWRGRHAERAVENAKLECSLRVIDGEHPGLTRRWRSGIAELGPGLVRFNPRGPLGSATTVVVRSVSRARQRRPSGRETWMVNQQCRIVEVETPSATLEWAVVDRHLGWAIDQVRRETSA